MDLTVIVDERDHRLKGRSSSAWAKYADALRRISLAWRSSLFSRSRALSFAATSVVTPGLRPVSISAFLVHSCSVWAVQPILPAIERIVAQRDGCSASCSKTSRAARSRTSSENLFVVLPVMTPSSQQLGPPANPGRFISPLRARQDWDNARLRELSCRLRGV